MPGGVRGHLDDGTRRRTLGLGGIEWTNVELQFPVLLLVRDVRDVAHVWREAAVEHVVLLAQPLDAFALRGILLPSNGTSTRIWVQKAMNFPSGDQSVSTMPAPGV